MKKFLTFILASVLAVSAFSMTASAAYVTMYAQDGRTITVHDSEVWAYRNVGWYTEPFVTMYALDGREIRVQKSQVTAYRNVGWYTDNEIYWLTKAVPSFRRLIDNNDYLSLYFSANEWIYDSEYSPLYSDTLYVYRTAAMDKWRTVSGVPIGLTAEEDELIEINDNGSVKVHFNYTNISYKPIIALKQEYSICNVFGDVLKTTTVTTGTDGDFYLAPGETTTDWSCTFSSYDNLGSARFIRNHRVLEVVFSDGTKWVNPGRYSSNGEKKDVYYAGYYFTSTGAPAYDVMWKY